MPGALEEPQWLAHVRVERASELEARLAALWNDAGHPPTVGVTDLVDLRRAFYRKTAPVPVDPARRRLQQSGRAAHERIGSVLGPADLREVRVRYGPIVGEIDFLDERPTEIKSTGELPDVASVAHWRPSYLEQLGMYCALVDRPEGRLVVASLDGPTPRLLVLDCRFEPIGTVRDEMRSRAELLLGALEEGRPDRLPRCAWRDRGCEFQAAGVCGCRGDEPDAGWPIRDRVTSAEARPAEAERLARALTAAMARPVPPTFRFRDLLYPRRAYFERVLGEDDSSAEATGAPPHRPGELFRRLRDLLDGAPEGEVTRRWPTGPEAAEPTTCLNGQPIVVKTTRAWREHPATAIPTVQPQYVLELGLRAAALGSAEGLLVVGYERAERREDVLRAYRVTFEDPGAPRELLSRRSAALERALATQDPAGLPSCPDWMVADCPYRARCGCGPSTGGA